jgi:hypothetical protein
VTTRTLTPSLAVTFGLAWGIAALLIFFTDQIVAVFGEITSSNPPAEYQRLSSCLILAESNKNTLKGPNTYENNDM